MRDLEEGIAESGKATNTFGEWSSMIPLLFSSVLLDMMSLQEETGLEKTKEEHACGIFLDANSVNKTLEVGCSKTQALSALSWLWRNYLWAAGAQRYGLQESTNTNRKGKQRSHAETRQLLSIKQALLESQAFCPII